MLTILEQANGYYLMAQALQESGLDGSHYYQLGNECMRLYRQSNLKVA